MLRYLLLARTGSGRTFFQRKLEEQGIRVARSHTTRPQRDESDYFHYFEKHDIPEKIAETEHDGYSYFYTKEELRKASVIPIDPEHIETVCNLFPDDIFRIIEIMASNEDRIKHCTTKTTEKAIAEQDDFIIRCEEENKSFSEFEDAITQSKLNIKNIYQAQMINNNFTDTADMIGFAQTLPVYFHEFNNVRKIVTELKSLDVFNLDENDYILMAIKDGEDSIKYEPRSIDAMSEEILIDPEGFNHIMRIWLQKH